MTRKKKHRKDKSKEQSLLEGLALWFSFTFTSIVIYLGYLDIGNDGTSKAVAIIIGIIGVVGLSIEVDKLSGGDSSIGLSNLGIGLLMGVIYLTVEEFTNHWLINIILILVLIFTFYGILLGIFMTFRFMLKSGDSWKKVVFIKLPVIIGQLAAFSLTILQIYQVVRG